jgi:hypothetical protein
LATDVVSVTSGAASAASLPGRCVCRTLTGCGRGVRESAAACWTLREVGVDSDEAPVGPDPDDGAGITAGVAACKAATSSPQVGKRSSGFLARERPMMTCSGGGSDDRSGGFWTCCNSS